MIPFNRAPQLGTEIQHLQDLLNTKDSLSAQGFYGKRCEKFLEDHYTCQVFLTTSATHALEMMALLLECTEDDEIILPSFTFVSTANAFALRGSQLKFADCDDFGNLDINHARSLITPRTKALCTVHYAGTSGPMDQLVSLCRQHNIALLEDAAQAFGGSYKGQALGTFGDLACLSFHDTKNITCGEGGALLINNSKYIDRSHILRDKGTNRRAFLMGLVDKYTWVDIGSSYGLSELNSAYLWDQLQQWPKIQDKRVRIHTQYAEFLSPRLPKGWQILQTPPHCVNNGHIFALLAPSFEERNQFIHTMRDHQVSCTFHYIPLHSAPFAKNLYLKGGGAQEAAHLPHTDRFANCLVRLPIFYNMKDDEVKQVLDACVSSFR